ncbi:MAG: archaeal proteasome endopeptidase complex subunit alpha [Euryarchaeota archaeon]|nr:archaeal proteasome endopeptidase complex subunit alpha [Euryarchaeota archaeon]MDE1836160.1 archaeal proteasome endopeptidase complex subunit alpha [Euryarchaeota archaeon]MDE1881015.1 archaeal proteasome endopeptidase complex subunit alpha [Euryarchaeota archaeon]MDE2045477.1 archaeal proteasome endopeptidase complex subunit alpha [Thermoplasmata archaeon]
MEMQPGQMAYDRAITVFSPDGRLFQVEYARESVRRGTATAGVVAKDGVVLVADRRIPNPKLAEASSVEKIHQIDEHIGAATAGLVADARVLVDYARLASQINRVTYAEPISLEVLVRRICDYKQQYTQYGGVRPFGTALLIGGYDDTGVHLFETDPSGSLTSFKASSIGGNRTPVMELFEQKYQTGMDIEAAALLALEGLQQSMEDPSNLNSVEMCTIQKDKGFTRLNSEQIQKYVSRLAPKEKGSKG